MRPVFLTISWAHEVKDSLWFTTRSGLFDPGEGAWDEVARYAGPLRRLLARSYGKWLSESDRDDLAQDVLLEIKEKLVGTFDPSRGKFRALLQAVVRRRVIDVLRKSRPSQLDEVMVEGVATVDQAEIEALDLETALIDAVTDCRDRFSQGSQKDLEVLYALIDRLVHGRTNVEIAERNGVSVDRVARLLRRGREVIFSSFISRELSLDPTGPDFKSALSAFKQCLRKPRAVASLLQEVKQDDIRQRLEDTLERFRAALPRFRGDGSVEGHELLRGIELVLEDLGDDAGSGED